MILTQAYKCTRLEDLSQILPLLSFHLLSILIASIFSSLSIPRYRGTLQGTSMSWERIQSGQETLFEIVSNALQVYSSYRCYTFQGSGLPSTTTQGCSGNQGSCHCHTRRSPSCWGSSLDLFK